MRFQRPGNGHIETIKNAWLWTLLFGVFYFAFRGIWTHAVVGFGLALLTGGFSWLLYPFFAERIVRAHYLHQGWVQLPN